MESPFKMKSKQTLVFDFSNLNSETVFDDEYEGDGILEGKIIFLIHFMCFLGMKI